jgi:queuine tRNA-ribosyltransferase catalytic subunit
MASQRSNRFLVTTCAGGTLAVFSVGYPLDLVVCTALGVDMYDCVYPTRTARFGVALVSGRAPGTLRLKSNDFRADETKPLSDDCTCQACREGISRHRLQQLFKAGHAVAIELLTQHNIAYMMNLVRTMRQAILDDRFAAFAYKFVREQYPGTAAGGLDVPGWVADALAAAGISLDSGTDNVH